MKVIMILTNGFDPDVRVYKEAKYLVSKGFEVTILCWDRKCEYSSKIEEVVDGIEIKRFEIPSKPGTGFKQIVPYLKFMKQVRKYLKDEKYEYLHCHDFDGIVVGMFAKKRKSQKVIFDMHEYYNTGIYAKFYWIVEKMINFLQKKSYKVIHVNNYQIEKVLDENREKLVFLPNYPELEQFKKLKHQPSDKIRIIYAGYVRHFIPLTNLAKAVNELQNITVEVHGTGDKFEQVKALEKEYKNFKVFGKFEHDEIIDFYSNSDLVYIVYDKGNKNNETALPTKFFEAIASCIPVIVSNNSLLEEKVKEYDIGFSVEDTDYKSIKNVLEEIEKNDEILKQKRENIKKIPEKFSWEEIVKNLDEIYKEKG